MTEERSTRIRLFVAADAKGRVVAAAYGVKDDEMHSGIEALEGQTVKEVDVPSELASAHPNAILAALDGATIEPSGALKLKKMRQIE